MQPVDYIILSVYLLIVLLVGIFITHRKRLGVEEFFTTNRSMGWLTVGLSVMVTAFSAVNYTAFSGEVFSHGLYVMLSLPVFVLVAVPVNRIIIPHFYRQNYATAYEYLDKRFDTKVRVLAAILFLIWRTFWGATILYIPTKILNLVTGWSIPLIIIIVGISVLFYTTYGGIRAVMITDSIQFFVLFTGLIIGILTMSNIYAGGFLEIFQLGIDNGLAKPFYPFDAAIFSFDPTIRISFWSCTIGTFVAFLARYSSDQMVVQRYFTAKSEKDAQKGFWLNVASAIISLSILAVLGFMIFAHANLQGTIGRFDKPLIYFVNFIKDLPPGVSGLLIAGLIAATMSSIDSGSNSCTRAWISDVLEPLSGKKVNIKSTRLFSIFFGLVIIGMSLFVGRLGSIFEIANKIVNGFGSPLLALFFVGVYRHKLSSKAVLAGGILGAFFSAAVSLFVKSIALHYYAVINLIGTILIILLFNIVFHTASLISKN